MPLVRIDVDASTSSEALSAICDAVYDAMTSTAKVPLHDKFMIVSKHEAGELVFPQEGYLGVKYTPGIVFISDHLECGPHDGRQEGLVQKGRRRHSREDRYPQGRRLDQPRRGRAGELVLRQR